MPDFSPKSVTLPSIFEQYREYIFWYTEELLRDNYIMEYYEADSSSSSSVEIILLLLAVWSYFYYEVSAVSVLFFKKRPGVPDF